MKKYQIEFTEDELLMLCHILEFSYNDFESWDGFEEMRCDLTGIVMDEDGDEYVERWYSVKLCND